MSEIIAPGSGLIFMKVGTHAKETLADIIERKRREIANAGHALWGYGGNTCHPRSMVQPFARAFERKGKTIYLCMEEMNSKHFADPIRADEQSVDGITWTEIPPAISVVGSRFALVISDLHVDEFQLPLARARVAVGNNAGRPGDDYIRGQVDKACLEMVDEAVVGHPDRNIAIGLVAKLDEPYAVFLRNRAK